MSTTFTFPDGLTVRRLGYGAMRLTGQPGNFGRYADWEGGKALLRTAVADGVQFIDTARAYGPGWNETLIAEALAPYAEDVVIATKGGIDKTGPTSADIHANGRPDALRLHVEESLRRLQVAQIDLYYLHRPDPRVPFAESVGALEEARRRGEIARIGLSNVTLDQVKEAMQIAPIAAVQNRYDPARGGDQAVLDFTTEKGIAFVPWGPLGANPMQPGSPFAADAQGSGLTVQQALRALLDRAPNILPIPGTRSVAHLRENLAVMDPSAN